MQENKNDSESSSHSNYENNLEKDKLFSKIYSDQNIIGNKEIQK